MTEIQKLLTETYLQEKDIVKFKLDVQLDNKPQTVEKSSSNTFVYLYTNIKEVTITDEMTETEITKWQADKYWVYNDVFFKNALSVAEDNSVLLEENLVILNQLLADKELEVLNLKQQLDTTTAIVADMQLQMIGGM